MGENGNPELFGGYFYGMAKDMAAEKAHAVPCPEAPNNRLLLCSNASVDFLGLKWHESFFFNNSYQLQQVRLSGPRQAVEELYRLIDSMHEAGWQAAFMEAPEAAFDMLEESDAKGCKSAWKSAMEFIDRFIAHAELTIYFLPDAYFAKALTMPGSKAYNALLDRAPEGIVVAAISVTEDNLSISFNAPLLSRKNALRYGQYIKR